MKSSRWSIRLALSGKNPVQPGPEQDRHLHGPDQQIGVDPTFLIGANSTHAERTNTGPFLRRPLGQADRTNQIIREPQDSMGKSPFVQDDRPGNHQSTSLTGNTLLSICKPALPLLVDSADSSGSFDRTRISGPCSMVPVLSCMRYRLFQSWGDIRKITFIGGKMPFSRIRSRSIKASMKKTLKQDRFICPRTIDETRKSWPYGVIITPLSCLSRFRRSIQ